MRSSGNGPRFWRALIERRGQRRERASTVIDHAIAVLTPMTRVRQACAATGRAPVSYYRAHPKTADTTLVSTETARKWGHAAGLACTGGECAAAGIVDRRACACVGCAEFRAVRRHGPVQVYAALARRGHLPVHRVDDVSDSPGRSSRACDASGRGETGTDCSPTEFRLVPGLSRSCTAGRSGRTATCI